MTQEDYIGSLMEKAEAVKSSSEVFKEFIQPIHAPSAKDLGYFENANTQEEIEEANKGLPEAHVYT